MTAHEFRSILSWRDTCRVEAITFDGTGRRLLVALANGEWFDSSLSLRVFDLVKADTHGAIPFPGDAARRVTCVDPSTAWVDLYHGARCAVDLLAHTASVLPRGPVPWTVGEACSAGSSGRAIHVDGVFTRTIFDGSGEIDCMRLHPDGFRLLTGSRGARAAVWDLANGLCITTRRHPRGVTAVAFTRDGRTALTASGRARQVLHWKLERGTLIRRLPVGVHVRAIEAHPDGRHVLLVTRRGSLAVWDLRTRRLLGPPRQPSFVVQHVATRGRLVALAGYGRVEVLRLRTGSSERTAPFVVRSLALSR